ncbi:MAG: hypothetical protein JSW62_04115 [Thermoplasmatales archaeon]|nr:MAG: hypothetical protein JSW62_04115 [Thermoplasmatales archaeon]
MRKILKGAVVLLISVALFLSTAVTADTIKETNEAQTDSSSIKSSNTNPSEPIIEPVLGPTLFLQSPYPSTGYWQAYTSDINSPYICYDNFWGVNEYICDIHWWGLVGYWTGSEWIPCECTDMLFEIWFYTDDNGAPGEPVCVYTDVDPVCTYYDEYDGWTAYEWYICLQTCCGLSKGWISIRGSYHPEQCWFLWMGSPDGDGIFLQDGVGWREDDLAFELTGEGKPSIDVEKYVWDNKNQRWVDADYEYEALEVCICNDVTFKIVIHNNGEEPLRDLWIEDIMHDSLKFISADPDPDDDAYDPPFYYMWWYFPGLLYPCETIEIYITAHVEGPECSYDYNFVHVEADYCGSHIVDEDYAYVHAKEKAREFNTLILDWLQNHPNMFPLLQLILKHLGLY